MNELGHLATLLNNLVQVVSRVLHEFFNSFLVGEHAVLLIDSVLVNTEVGLARHKQAVFNNVNQAETEEI